MPLGATVVFSSVAGRFGNNGQTDYSAVTDNQLIIANWRAATDAVKDAYAGLKKTAEAVDAAISTYCVSDFAEEWDLDGLVAEVHAVMGGRRERLPAP